MNRFSGILLAIFSCFQIIHSQSSEKDYYTGLNVNNFRKDKSLNESMDFNNLDFERIHAAVFWVTNEQRYKNKLKVLGYSPQLEKIATMHSKDMYEKNFFSHENKKDKKKLTPNNRAALVGVINPFIAENIAEAFGLQYKPETNVYILASGQFSYKSGGDPIPPHTYLTFADALVKSWMNSPGHKKNILSENAVQLGCGVFFYRDKEFNQMPSFKATQNFQWYEPIKIK